MRTDATAVRLLPYFDLIRGDLSAYRSAGAGILIVDAEGRLLLQRRTDDAPRAAGMLGLFGGGRESAECLDETLLRELQEELGWAPEADALHLLGLVELDQMGATSLSARFFARLPQGTPLTCMEGAIEEHSCRTALECPSLTLCARWTIEAALHKGLIA